MKRFLIALLVVLFVASSFGCNKISKNIETKITNVDTIQKGKVTYKKVPLNIYSGGVSTFALCYDNNKRMYVALKGGEIYKTEDMGKTWEKIAKIVIRQVDSYNFFGINSITESDNGRVLYVVTTQDILKSEDYGKTFTEIGNSFPLTFVPGSILVSRDSPNLIMVTGTNGATDIWAIFRSSDGGLTWKAIRGNLSSVVYNYATDELFATDGTSLLVSKDFGLNWEKIKGDFNSVNFFSISQTNPTTIVVNAQDGVNAPYETYISKDSGKHFKKITASFPFSFYEVCINPRDTNNIVVLPVYARTFADEKIFVSRDGGTSFKDYPVFNSVGASQFSFDGSKLFIRTNYGALYSWDGSGAFKLENVFPEVEFNDIKIYGSTGIILTNAAPFKVDLSNGNVTTLNKDGFDFLAHIAISEREGEVTYATSYARLFSLQDTNFKSVNNMEHIEHIRISPFDSNELFITTTDENGGGVTYVSSDSGKTFKPLSFSKQHYAIAAVTFDTNNPSIIYAIGRDTENGHIALYKSNDNGKTFTKVSEDLPVEPYYDISLSMFDSSIYVYGWSFGIFKSDDYGRSFKTFNKGISKIQNLGITKLEFNLKTKDLFLLTYSNGLFMCKNGSDTWVDISGDFPKDKISALAVDKETGKVYVGVDGIGLFEVIP